MKRSLLDSLYQWKVQKKRKPLLIRGVRQVGKTYLLQHFGESCFRRVHYFNFEEDGQLAAFFARDLRPDRILAELEFHSGQPIDRRQDLVIFDEIQEVPRALTSLKYFHERMSELAVCAAGSLLGVRLNAGSFPVGKVEIVDLYPLSFLEFLDALGDSQEVDFLRRWEVGTQIPLALHLRLWERLKWYFVVGGLPEVVATFVEERGHPLVAFEKVRKRQEQLITAYLADIAKHAGKVNAMHIERVLRAVPAQLSATENGNASRFRFRGVVPHVDRYARLAGAIDWLEAAHMVIKVRIANSGQLPSLAYTEESRFKLLLFDIGMLGAMSDLSPKSILDYDYGSYKGYFAENFVAQELLCSGVSPLYSWQEERSEIEFLMEKGGKPLPVEVKAGMVTRAKSLAKFRQKFHPPKSVILSARELSIGEELLYLPLYLAGSVPNSFTL